MYAIPTLSCSPPPLLLQVVSWPSLAALDATMAAIDRPPSAAENSTYSIWTAAIYGGSPPAWLWYYNGRPVSEEDLRWAPGYPKDPMTKPFMVMYYLGKQVVVANVGWFEADAYPSCAILGEWQHARCGRGSEECSRAACVCQANELHHAVHAPW